MLDRAYEQGVGWWVVAITRTQLDYFRFLHRPFSYSTKEPGSSDIFIQFYTRSSIEWR